MNRMNPHNEVADQVRTRLLEEISQGEFLEAKRLPPENELAKQFGVSRNVIRDCLAQLQREGYVSRRPGLGTIINRHIVEAYPRFDLSYNIAATMRYYGKEPSVTDVRSFPAAAEAEIAAPMQLSDGAPLLGVERVFRMDGEPIIYCCDYIPDVLVPANDYGPEHFTPSIYAFLRDICQIEVYNSLSEFRAVLPPPEIVEKLQLTEKEPMLYLTEVGYTFQGQPVLYTIEYLKDGSIPHRILRQVI